ncbi:MAG: 1-acyl-sn-glycerol-3-phosphate acyltransferase [Dehalococcoidales bacterium]|nr:1-acyl-sn-glycerol-3-phosphate acyltransferase [Dehalococcoidales bacterium]
MHWVYYFGRVLIRLLVFPVGNWRVKGRENVPERGPLLIVCNHLHIADPPIVAASIPLKVVFMAKDDLWESGWSRFWVENFGAFPVRRGGIDREALYQAERWLKRGVSVMMFPEGSRSKTSSMQPALPGAALIASRLGVPILPVGISGTDRLRKLGWAVLHRPTVTVMIGKPFNPPLPDGKLNREQRNQLMYDIMRKVAELLPPEYHGVYSEDKNAPD